MILIRNGKVFYKGNWHRLNIIISNEGYIVRLFRSGYLRYYTSHVDAVYDARGALILPGLVDIHVHMRDLGERHKETFESGTKAAISGGVTVIGDMPNNKPPINSIDRLSQKEKVAKIKAYADYFLYVLLNKPAELEKIGRFLRQVYVKVYLYKKEQYKMLLKYQEKLPRDYLYVFHAEHPRASEPLDFKDAWDLHKKRSPKSEMEGVKIAISFAEKGYKVHVTHVTTPQAVNLIESAMKRGVDISYDVTPHHLIFYLERIDPKDPIFKVLPPLRPKAVRDGLINNLFRGHIRIIATDHAPHSSQEKKLSFSEAPAGIASIQYLLPILFSLSKKLGVSFEYLLTCVTANPARRFGIPGRGKIKVGMLADLVIFDKSRHFFADPDYSFSLANLTPYNFLKLKGFVDAVFLRGVLVYEKGHFLSRLGKNIFSGGDDYGDI